MKRRFGFWLYCKDCSFYREYLIEVEKNKLLCNECGWTGRFRNALHGYSPFGDKDPIIGCTGCFDIGTLVTVCDEPNCKEIATCGTATNAMYRTTCVKHKIPAKTHILQ